MKITLNLITFALLVQTLWNDKLHTILSRDFDNKKSIVEGPTIWSGMVTSQQANTHIYVCVFFFGCDHYIYTYALAYAIKHTFVKFNLKFNFH
jgi:hypothetical protein